MNQSQIPGDGSPMQSGQPAVSKWLWITLIIVVLIAGAFFAWYYLMGPGKTVSSSTTTTPTTTKTTAPTTTTTTTPSTTTTTTTTTPATTATSATADWKTYTNSTYGFSVKYLPSITPKEINAASFTVDLGSESITAFSSTQSLNDWVSGAITDLPSGNTYTKSNITVAGLAATKMIVTTTGSNSAPAVWVFVVNNGNHYEIMSDTSDTNFDTFLSTFQFTK